jgi:CRISPR-associated protein Csx17
MPGCSGQRLLARGNTFVLSAHLDRDAILDFFLNRHAPSPIVAPWSGGSGFHPKDNSTAIASDPSRRAGWTALPLIENPRHPDFPRFSYR